MGLVSAAANELQIINLIPASRQASMLTMQKRPGVLLQASRRMIPASLAPDTALKRC